jgi:hypothetical protein
MRSGLMPAADFAFSIGTAAVLMVPFDHSGVIVREGGRSSTPRKFGSITGGSDY